MSKKRTIDDVVKKENIGQLLWMMCLLMHSCINII